MSKALHVSPPSCAAIQGRGNPDNSASSVAGVRARMSIASASTNGRRVRSVSSVIGTSFSGVTPEVASAPVNIIMFFNPGMRQLDPS